MYPLPSGSADIRDKEIQWDDDLDRLNIPDHFDD
jgi:hypothetical protein